MNKYFVEIGVEEFPSRFIPSTKDQLKNNLEKLLREKEVSFEAIRVTSTPRRFAIWVDDIKAEDKVKEEIVRGPSAKAAFDQEGHPSKALEGFMKGKGISLDQIYTEDTGKGEYVFARIPKDRVSIESVLKEAVPEAIRQVTNPRAMRWGGKNLRFLRPIRWIVSLYNDQVLSFAFEGIPVGRITRGHRFLGSQEIEIQKIDDYEKVLEQNGVIVDEEKRRDIIVRGLNREARQFGGFPMKDPELLEEVVYIVEYPTVFVGKIPADYLSLPPEIIITPMKDHQRYFPVLDDGGKLLPYFLSVRNGDGYGIENVIEGNEKVLVPRLEDARFFFEQDLKQPLEAFLPKLEGVVFHENLGTMMDKTHRLQKLAASISKDLMTGEDTKDNATRAALLSKADLTTNMVVEFTELQGVMGRIYAEKSGEKPLVAKAIEEQYLPRTSGGNLPETTAGMILSLADKIDTLAGLYAIGMEVTGSQDPNGLRRAAIGIIEILYHAKIHFDLMKSFRDALVFYVEDQGLVFDYDEVISKIESFFLGRLHTILRDQGVRYDIIDAVFAGQNEDLLCMMNKVYGLQSYLEKEGSEAAVTSFVRVESMAKNYLGDPLNPKDLEKEDQGIYESLKRKEAIEEDLCLSHYEKALEKLEDWMNVVNPYMDQTMILVNDPALRSARLAILHEIDQLIEKIFVPSKIVRP